MFLWATPIGFGCDVYQAVGFTHGYLQCVPTGHFAGKESGMVNGEWLLGNGSEKMWDWVIGLFVYLERENETVL